MPRRRVKHKASFEDRLTDEARRFKEQAEELPPGPQRDDLKRKARDAEAAAHAGGLPSPLDPDEMILAAHLRGI